MHTDFIDFCNYQVELSRIKVTTLALLIFLPCCLLVNHPPPPGSLNVPNTPDRIGLTLQVFSEQFNTIKTLTHSLDVIKN